MDKLTVYDDDGAPLATFEYANGFVARCVASIADDNILDAYRAARILNAAVEKGEG